MRAKFKFNPNVGFSPLGMGRWEFTDGKKLPPGGALVDYCNIELCLGEAHKLLGVETEWGSFWVDIRPEIPDNPEGWKEISFGEGWVTVDGQDATITCFQELGLETVLPEGRGFIKVEI